MKYSQWWSSSPKNNFIKIDEDIPLIKETFMKANYLARFHNIVINEFQKGKDHGDQIL